MDHLNEFTFNFPSKLMSNKYVLLLPVADDFVHIHVTLCSGPSLPYH